jgi:hypothetical protein
VLLLGEAAAVELELFWCAARKEFSKIRSCHGFSAHLCGSQGGGEVRKRLVQREVAAALVKRRQIRRRATTAPTYSHIK